MRWILSILFCACTIFAQPGVSIGSGVSIGGGTPLPVINLGTQSGVDCTGTSDSSSGINTVFSSLTGHKLVIPYGCKLQVTSQLVIQGQTDFSIEGAGFMPNQASAAPFIFGCSGAAGPVLYINRSGYWKISNFGVYAKGASCSSSFTGSVVWSNLGTGGFTSTYSIVEGMSLETNPNGAKISGYFGLGLGMNSSGIVTQAPNPNEEQLTFRDNFVHCQNSPASYGLWMFAANADNGSAINNRMDSCFQAIRIEGGDLKLIEKNHFDSNGNYSVFGANGAGIYISSCASGVMSINANEFGDGGPMLNTNNDTYTATCPLFITGNWIGISDMAPAAFPVNLIVPGDTPALVEGNQFFLTTSTTQVAIGSSSQSNCSFGPVGRLMDIGNTINDGSKVGGWTGCVGMGGVLPYQNGEYHQFSPSGRKTLVIEQSGNNADLRNASQVYAYPDATSSSVTCDRVGHIWFDTTTSTTVEKHCLNVSGILTWVTK